MSVDLLTVRDLALVEATARRVLELLGERLDRAAQQGSARLVDATELARILGISRSTVYDRAADFGAISLGDGPRARLRFDVETARNAWTRRVWVAAVPEQGDEFLTVAEIAVSITNTVGPKGPEWFSATLTKCWAVPPSRSMQVVARPSRR